jgi:hypothetical protein
MRLFHEKCNRSAPLNFNYSIFIAMAQMGKKTKFFSMGTDIAFSSLWRPQQSIFPAGISPRIKVRARSISGIRPERSAPKRRRDHACFPLIFLAGMHGSDSRPSFANEDSQSWSESSVIYQVHTSALFRDVHCDNIWIDAVNTCSCRFIPVPSAMQMAMVLET